jgi:predicted NUDIX family NTP pyrophosphohydrolase
MKKSAGIILYRKKSHIELFLVHPGGPFWSKKHEHTWSIPKGEPGDGEEMLYAAIREFHEETGIILEGEFIEMNPVRQSKDKMVYAWILEGDLDPENIISNCFEMEWPPSSGKMQKFPEVDSGAWFTPDVAREKIVKGQIPLIDQLEILIK